MQHLTDAMKASTFGIMQWIYHYFYLLSPLLWGCSITIAATLALAGLRLTRFSHPHIPRLSQAIRHVSYPLLFWPSLIALIVSLLGWGFLLGMSKEHHIFDRVWLGMASRLQSIGIGAGAGILVGGGFFYWLIPGWERPAVSAADPDAAVPVIRDYDPERYFDV